MTYTIIDPHAHIIPQREPVWGWGPNFTVERLLAMMDRDYDIMGETKHVAKAVVMTGLGLTSVEHRTMAEAHKYPLASIKQHPDRLYLNPVINPRAYVPDQLYQIRDWKTEYNVRMLKIHPSMHNYYLPTYSPFPGEVSKKLVYPIFELARELGVPVMAHMGETPYSIPSQLAPVAEAFPDVNILVAHSGANNLPGLANGCDPAGAHARQHLPGSELGSGAGDRADVLRHRRQQDGLGKRLLAAVDGPVVALRHQSAPAAAAGRRRQRG